MTNKYAEGYPGKRYYGGCVHVDEAENLAISRLKKLFGVEYGNVQPHSGSQANMAVFMTFLNVGDTIMGLDLAHGGHLTHGNSVNFSGQLYNSVLYQVKKETGRVDFDNVRKLAKEYKPKIIICGGSAYPRYIEFEIFSEIAKEVGAFLMADIAHPSGLIAAGIASIYAFLWLNDGLLMSETLVIPIVAITVGLSARLYKKNSLRLLIAFGVAGGLAVLTRAELIIIIPFLALPILRNSSQTLKKRLTKYFLVGVIIASVLAPWVARNLIQFEEPVLLSNGSGILLAQTNCEATYFGDKQGYWEYLCGLPQPVGQDGEPTDESIRDKEYRSRGIEYAAEHKGRLFGHVIPKRIARLWGFYSPLEQLRVTCPHSLIYLLAKNARWLSEILS